MKHYLLLALLLLVGAPCFAQDTPPAELLKGANTILITTTDSIAPAWRRMRETLLAQGYSLAQSDSEVHSFSTSPKIVKAGRTLTITGFVKQGAAGETIISLAGSYIVLKTTMQGQFQVVRQAAWAGGKSGNDKVMFTQVEQLAKAYPSQSKRLSYSIR